MKIKRLIFLNLIIVLFLIGVVVGFSVKAPSEPIDIDGNKKYTLEDGESFTVTYESKSGKDVDFDFSNLKSTSKGKPTFTLNEEGKIIAARFKTSKTADYILGNELISIPANSEVDFENGRSEITIPKDHKLTAAKPLNDEPGETTFEFSTADGKFLFEGNNFFQLENDKKLKFKDGQYFIDYNGKAKLNEVNIINEGKTFVDFKGQINGDYDGGYISIDDANGRFVTGSNIDKRGPKVSFSKDNPYDIRIQSDQDHIAVWSLGNKDGAYVKIQNRNNKDLIPKMDTLNQFAMNFDEKTVHYNSDRENLYLSKKVLLDGFTTGKSSIPIEVHSFKNKNGRIEPISTRGNVMGIGDHVEFAYGRDPRFIKTSSSYANYASLKRGFSNNWLYYNLKTVRDMRRFLGKRNINDYSGVLNNPGNVKWVTDLMAGLPAPVFNSVKTLSFENQVTYRDDKGRIHNAAGLTSANGLVRISRGNFEPTTIRHEITHAYQFASPQGFWNDWQSVGYTPKKQLSTWSRGTQGFSWGYGSKNWYEDGATFGDYVYNPEYWDNFITSRNSYNKIYRGKLAVMRKYNFITQQEYANIFQRAGLDSSSSSVQKYINDARSFVT